MFQTSISTISLPFSETFCCFHFRSSLNLNSTLLLIYFIIDSYYKSWSILTSSLNRVIQRILPVSLLYLSGLLQCKNGLIVMFPCVRAVVLKHFGIMYILVNLFNVWLNRRQLDSHTCFVFNLLQYVVFHEEYEQNMPYWYENRKSMLKLDLCLTLAFI